MLTIAKTPVRISFFGGGTDYPAYLEHNDGAVLGATIDKFIYTVALPMVGFAENRYRITYRQVEAVDTVDAITHPVVRASMQLLGFDAPLNIAILSDMPGGTGLGSSSAFTVGFVNLLSHLQRRPLSRYDLAQTAIKIEHDILKENVGVQDQVHAAFGGLSHYTLRRREIMIRPITIHTDCRAALDSSLVLVFTDAQRHASSVLEEQMERTKSKENDASLSHLVALARQGIAVFEQSSPEQMLKDLGAMLHDSWITKRGLSSNISNDRIDELYAAGRALGAYGGKLCGAGKGGFFLFLTPSHTIPEFECTFGAANVVRVRLEDRGSRVTTHGGADLSGPLLYESFAGNASAGTTNRWPNAA